MTVTLQQLQDDVMARLGEIPWGQSPLPASGVPSPADIVALKVESILPEAGMRIIRDAPPDMIGAGKLVEGDVSLRLMPCGLYAGEIVLPAGFLRLVSVRMSGWNRVAGRLILPGDADWECQWSEEPGIAGCPLRPRAYLVEEGDGMLLRILGCEDAGTSLWYLRILSVPAPPAFHFPRQLYPQLVATVVDKII